MIIVVVVVLSLSLSRARAFVKIVKKKNEEEAWIFENLGDFRFLKLGVGEISLSLLKRDVKVNMIYKLTVQTRARARNTYMTCA